MIRDLSMIACVSRDGGLGKDNDLLWRFKDDMKFFKETTLGSTVAMGSKTFQSLGKALPGRKNVVLSRHPGDSADVTWCQSREELDQLLRETEGQKFIIGGASLYAMYLPEVEKIYLTEVDAVKPADVYFPEFQTADFERKVLKTGNTDGVRYEMVEYTRKAA